MPICLATIVALGFILSFAECKTETLRFADDFEELDTAKWKHEITMGGGGNWEFQLYQNSRSNSYVKDGVLYIKPTLTADSIGEDKVLNGHRMDMWGSSPADLCTGNAFWGCERSSNGRNIINPISSARLRTAETFSFKYGRVEVRAKMPKGDWIWPAIWLLPLHNRYGNWPMSGEIDIVESRGNVVPKLGVDTFGSTLHWGPRSDLNGYLFTHAEHTLQGKDFSEDFHLFGLYWDENELYTYLDDPTNKVLSLDMRPQGFWDRAKSSNLGWDSKPKVQNPWVNAANQAPFDQEFFLVINNAVGGTLGYFPDTFPGKLWSDKSESASAEFYRARSKWEPTWKGESVALQIDSVKIWTFPESNFTYHSTFNTGVPKPAIEALTDSSGTNLDVSAVPILESRSNATAIALAAAGLLVGFVACVLAAYAVWQTRLVVLDKKDLNCDPKPEHRGVELNSVNRRPEPDISP